MNQHTGRTFLRFPITAYSHQPWKVKAYSNSTHLPTSDTHKQPHNTASPRPSPPLPPREKPPSPSPPSPSIPSPHRPSQSHLPSRFLSTRPAPTPRSYPPACPPGPPPPSNTSKTAPVPNHPSSPLAPQKLRPSGTLPDRLRGKGVGRCRTRTRDGRWR